MAIVDTRPAKNGVGVLGRDDFGLFWNFSTGKQILLCVIKTKRIRESNPKNFVADFSASRKSATLFFTKRRGGGQKIYTNLGVRSSLKTQSHRPKDLKSKRGPEGGYLDNQGAR